MSPRARLLHVLASAPLAVLLTANLAPSAHADTRTFAASVESSRPVPYVVAVDAGHGGTPDNKHPGVPFDPGVIGPHGLMEKDVTLDVAQRIQRLLVGEGVNVVMTRNDDRFVDVGSRMQTAIERHASLFVSVHMNSFESASAGGTTVLYPGPSSSAFAKVMSTTLGTRLGPIGLANDGLQVKDDLWVHATMPAVTVEAAYLSNPHEEALMKRSSAREAIATSIVAGIEQQAPAIAALRQRIAAWEQAHSAVAVPEVVAAVADVSGHGARNLVLFVLAMMTWWQRSVMLPLAWRVLRLSWRLTNFAIRSLLGHSPEHNNRRSARERRHQRLKRGRRQALLERSQRLGSRRQTVGGRSGYRSVYDDLNL